MRYRDTTFVVDEAFADFVDGFDSITVGRPANVVALCSLTKFYAIPGLRLGCAVADRELVERAKELVPPWSVNTLAQAVGAIALLDEDYATRTCELVRAQRERLFDDLRRIPGVATYDGEANFLLVKLNRSDIDAPELANRLLRQGIAIRVCDNFDGLDRRFFRVAVRTDAENALLIMSLRSAMCRSRRGSRRAASLRGARFTRRFALLGVITEHRPLCSSTSSNAGKSVLTAALCRPASGWYLVAPFKAQNMSLNSYVTSRRRRDGQSAGRAGSCLPHRPRRAMNPILLAE